MDNSERVAAALERLVALFEEQTELIRSSWTNNSRQGELHLAIAQRNEEANLKRDADVAAVKASEKRYWDAMNDQIRDARRLPPIPTPSKREE